MFEQLPRGLVVCFFHELRDSKLYGSVNVYKEIKFAFYRPNFCDVCVEETP